VCFGLVVCAFGWVKISAQKKCVIYFCVFFSLAFIMVHSLTFTMTRADSTSASKPKVHKSKTVVKKELAKAKRTQRVRSSNGVLKVCVTCKIEKDLTEFNLNAAKSGKGVQSTCKPCQSESMMKYYKTRKGFLNLMLNNSKTNSKAKEREGRDLGKHTLTLSDMEHMLKEQSNCCAFTGIPLVFSIGSNWQASLERRDDTKNYTRDNCVFVCLEFNTTSKWNEDKVLYALTHSDSVDQERVSDIVKLANTTGLSKYKVLGHDKNNTDNGNIWCRECENHYHPNAFLKEKGRGCKDCRTAENKAYSETWRGCFALQLQNAKGRCKLRDERGRKNMSMELTFDDVISMFVSQKGVCAYSGIPLTNKGEWKMSLERKNAKLGYTKRNTCIIVKELQSIDRRGGNKNTALEGCSWSTDKFQHAKQMYNTYKTNKA
jgi:hypothetical protein